MKATDDTLEALTKLRRSTVSDLARTSAAEGLLADDPGIGPRLGHAEVKNLAWSLMEARHRDQGTAELIAAFLARR